MDYSILIVYIVGSMFSLALATLITPGLRNKGGWGSLFLASIVMAFLNYYIIDRFGVRVGAIGRGGAGFLAATLVIYITGKVVPGYKVNIFGAMIGAIVLSGINMFLPGPFML